jgi:hypothetical protein
MHHQQMMVHLFYISIVLFAPLKLSSFIDSRILAYKKLGFQLYFYLFL